MFVGNTATTSGGAVGGYGVYTYTNALRTENNHLDSYPSNERKMIFRNCLLCGNLAYRAAVAQLEGYESVFHSCTMANNHTTIVTTSSEERGNITVAGVYGKDRYGGPQIYSAPIWMRNSIMANNQGGEVWWASFMTIGQNLLLKDLFWGQTELNANGDSDLGVQSPVLEEPRFIGGAADTWATSGQFSLKSNRTTIQSSMSFADNSLKGLIINPDTSQPLQTVIDSNQGNTMVLIGDMTNLAGTAKHFQIYDYHLRSSSPAVDAGTSDAAPTVDLDRNPRPQLSGYDIGAYEFTPSKNAARNCERY